MNTVTTLGATFSTTGANVVTIPSRVCVVVGSCAATVWPHETVMTTITKDRKIFLITRALFGIAMGGEWGVGAALAFETLPAEGRGFFSGLLQEGYVVGYLMAAIVYGTLFPILGWRGMFVIGALPAFLVIYIRSKVDESPAWLQGQVERKAERRLITKSPRRREGSSTSEPTPHRTRRPEA